MYGYNNQVRELHIRSELLPLETSAEELRKGGYKGVIISGGPNSVYAEDAPKVHQDLFDAGM
jgi:GMP synthase (glutamine-hydrolysing)